MIAGYFCNFYFRRQLYTVQYCCAVFCGASLAANPVTKGAAKSCLVDFSRLPKSFCTASALRHDRIRSDWIHRSHVWSHIWMPDLGFHRPKNRGLSGSVPNSDSQANGWFYACPIFMFAQQKGNIKGT